MQGGEVSPAAHAQHRRHERARPPQAPRARRPRRRSSAATASSTTGSATPRTRSTSPTSACGCAARSCTACRRRSARTGSGETGELFVGDDVFPELERAGDVTVHAAYVKPEGSAPAVKILHHMVICLAQEADLDPEPLLHPGARGDRCVRRSGEARRRRARHDALDQRLGQSDGAARGAPQFREAARCGVRIFEYPHDAAAPESDDDRRRVVRDRLEPISTTARSRSTTRSRWASTMPRRRSGSTQIFEKYVSALPRDQAGKVAQARAGAQAHRQRLLPRQRDTLTLRAVESYMRARAKRRGRLQRGLRRRTR